MSTIEYSDGTKIEFSGNPTQQDVQDAYDQVKGIKSTPAAAPATPTPQPKLGDAGQILGTVKNILVDPILHPIDNIIKPIAQLTASAINAPADLALGLMGKNPIGQGMNPVESFQSEFATKTVPKVMSGEISPLEATARTVGGVVGSGALLLGAEGSIPAVKAAAQATKRGITGAVSSITERVGGKTAAEILATPEAGVAKLTADQQKLWYRTQAQTAKETALAASEKAKIASDAAVTQAKNDINSFQQELGNVTRETAVSLKQPAQQLMKDTSAKYVELTGEAADASPALTKILPKDELVSAIDSKFEYNPEIGASLKADLGIGEEAVDLTNQQILDKAREIMQGVSKTAKSGGRVYTPAEYQATQKYSFLMEQLGKNGVDMTEANALWRQWAPVRDRIVREIKPFDEGNVGKMPLSSTLQKAESVAKTGAQATAKLDAQNFVTELETRLKLPKGSIGSDTRTAVSKVEQAKLAKIDAEKLAKKLQAAIKADKTKALQTMTLKQYDTLRKARINSLIKKTLIGLGILGAAKATGLDRAILNAAGLVI